MFKVLSILESTIGVLVVNLESYIGVVTLPNSILSYEKAVSILTLEFKIFLILTSYLGY